MYKFKILYQKYIDFLNANTLKEQPQGLYDPVNYIMNLGGKRVRPILAMMAYDMFGNDLNKSLPLAHAIEMFHNFSLVHDDIMDEATLRRGKPTVHQKYGLNAGVLSGDVMMIKTYSYLSELEGGNVLELIKIFNDVARLVCDGQQMDMDFETRNDVLISEYLLMVEYKTAILLAGALKMGAILGGATTQNAELLWEFGRNIGIAFQLQDDILDAYGDPLTFGKKVGGDIIQNKKTYLTLILLKNLDKSSQLDFEQLLNMSLMDESEKVARVTAMYNENEVREKATQKMNEYYQLAQKAISKVELTDDKNSIELLNLAKELMVRIS